MQYSSDDDNDSPKALNQEEIEQQEAEDRRKIFEEFQKHDPKHTDYIPTGKLREIMTALGENISQK